MSGAVMTSIAVGVGSSLAGAALSSMLAPDGQTPTPAAPTPALNQLAHLMHQWYVNLIQVVAQAQGQAQHQHLHY